MSKDIKSSQLKLAYAVRGRVLKELDLGLPRKVNENFLILDNKSELRSGVSPRVKSSINTVCECDLTETFGTSSNCYLQCFFTFSQV